MPVTWTKGGGYTAKRPQAPKPEPVSEPAKAEEPKRKIKIHNVKGDAED